VFLRRPLMRPRGPLSGIRSPLARRANPRVCLVPHAPGYPPACTRIPRGCRATAVAEPLSP
jgi:hypothetical protein